MDYQLSAQKRTARNPRALRREGFIPAVVYGADLPSTPIQVEAAAFNQLLSKLGRQSPIDLALEGETHRVVIRELQRDPLSREVIHVDFFKVSASNREETE